MSNIDAFSLEQYLKDIKVLLRELIEVSAHKSPSGNQATWKQKNYMKKLGIEFPDNITKQEAIKLIDKKVKK